MAAAGPAPIWRLAITSATASVGVACARAASIVNMCKGFAPKAASLSNTACICAAGLAIGARSGDVTARASSVITWSFMGMQEASVRRTADATNLLAFGSRSTRGRLLETPRRYFTITTFAFRVSACGERFAVVRVGPHWPGTGLV
jgi:hypothetical protein